MEAEWAVDGRQLDGIQDEAVLPRKQEGECQIRVSRATAFPRTVFPQSNRQDRQTGWADKQAT